MLNIKLNHLNILNKNDYFFYFLNNENQIWNFFFFILIFILIWFLYNNILNVLIKVNLFNKKFFFYGNKKRQLTEFFLKNLTQTIFIKFYKKIIFYKFV